MSENTLERVELASRLCRAAGAAMALFVVPDPDSEDGYRIEIGYSGAPADQALHLMSRVQKWAGVPAEARIQPDTDDDQEVDDHA